MRESQNLVVTTTLPPTRVLRVFDEHRGRFYARRGYIRRRIHTISPSFGPTAIGINNWHCQTSPLAPNQCQSAVLRAYYRVPESIQMGATPEAIGGGLNITFTTDSTFVGRGLDIRIACVLAGTRGVAKLNATLNGATVLLGVLTSAAPINVPGTDVYINCPTGSYTTSMSWRSICNNFLDKVGAYPLSTNNFANGTVGTTRPYITNPGILGGACVDFDGSNDRLVNTGPLGSDGFGGLDKPFYAGMLFRLMSLPASDGVFWCAGNLTNANLPRVEAAVNGPSRQWSCNRQSDGGTIRRLNSIIPSNFGGYLMEYAFDGTTSVVSMNTSDVIGGMNPDVVGTQSPSDITITQMAMGCRQAQNGSTMFVKAQVSEFFVFDQLVANTERQRLYLYYNGST